jgi:salicylate hydroxylase
LQTWGVYDIIKEQVCEPVVVTVYNYKGKVLAQEEAFDQKIRSKYSAPFSDCHRVDLQQALVRRAEELGVDVILNAKVSKINFGDVPGSEATITTEAGEGYIADLVVGADGLWSTCRSTMLGHRDPPLPTGDLAYRIVLNLDQIQDLKLRAMVQDPACRFWAGPDSHVVAYSLRGGNMYNVVLLVPDDLEEGVARTEGNLDEMRKLFEGWDPVYSLLSTPV